MRSIPFTPVSVYQKNRSIRLKSAAVLRNSNIISAHGSTSFLILDEGVSPHPQPGAFVFSSASAARLRLALPLEATLLYRIFRRMKTEKCGQKKLCPQKNY